MDTVVDNIKNKTSQNKIFSLFNFVITKTCVVIRLAENVTRIDDI